MTRIAPSTTPRTAVVLGMVMKPEPWGEALDDLLAIPSATAAAEPRLIVPSAVGYAVQARPMPSASARSPG